MRQRLVSGFSGPLALVLVALSLGACAGTTRGQVEASPSVRSAPSSASRGPLALEKQAMQVDVDEWVSTLEEVHPNPYTTIDRDAFHARVRAARDALADGSDPLEFYAVLQRLAALLGDSHTRFVPPRRSSAYSEPWWPIATSVRDGRVLVRKPAGGLAKGTELVEINGVSTARLLEAARALSSAERREGVDALVPYSFGIALWLEGVRAPFRVVGRAVAGAIVNATIEGAAPFSETAYEEGPAHEFRWLPGNVAYLAIFAMDDVDGFERFVADVFAAIDQKRARGLVVDLRNDLGGNTEVGELLLERITEKSYRMASEKQWRVSRRYQAEARRYYDPRGAYLTAQPGTTLVLRFDETRPREVSPRYAGPVCLLVGPGTLSSGMMLANAVGDYDLATLIGEPTSSPPNYFGETLQFELSSTKLTAIASVARFVRANGDASSTALVVPDILVAPSLEEWSRGDDPVLERALEWVRNGR